MAMIIVHVAKRQNAVRRANDRFFAIEPKCEHRLVDYILLVRIIDKRVNFLRVRAGGNAKLTGKFAAKKIVWHDNRLAERNALNRRQTTELKIYIKNIFLVFFFSTAVVPPAYIWIADC